MLADNVNRHLGSAEELYRKTNHITGPLTDEQKSEIAAFAGNHIGLFVRWLIEHNLEGPAANEEDCRKVRNGEMSGFEYLQKNCGGELTDPHIKKSALPFVEYYYTNRLYYGDYSECCISEDKPTYGVISTEEDYRRLEAEIDAAYRSYTKSWNDSLMRVLDFINK